MSLVDHTLVLAAGGVPWRRRPGHTEVALVHRPRYGDWSLPKGKVEPGEHLLHGAVREVAEETGLHCVPQVRLPDVQYLTGVPGVTKLVRYWSMRVQATGAWQATSEIDEVRWVPLESAGELVSYAHDRGVLAAFAALPPVDQEVILVRHGVAGSRRDWPGPDHLRPLDGQGMAQATALSGVLAVFQPATVVSASPWRCQQTVAGLGRPVQVEPDFDEPQPAGQDLVADWAAQPGRPIRRARMRLLALLDRPGPIVVCSQGKVIPALLQDLAPLGVGRGTAFDTTKGTGWLVTFSGGQAVGADPIVPAGQAIPADPVSHADAATPTDPVSPASK